MAKQVALTKGMFAIVDDADFELVCGFTWLAVKSRGSHTFYAACWIYDEEGKRHFQLMHRTIMSASATQQVDHADGNGLNNQRGNLRFCTNAENQYNRRLPSNNTSGYKGVSFHKLSGLWRVSITHESKRFYLGYFKVLEDAAQAYDKAALQLHGEFAKLNFPTRRRS